MRYLIVGTSGAGKTAFANALAEAARCPHVELDALHWGPNWTPVPPKQFERAVRDATQGERWVTDGNYSAVRDVLWPRATHVVWLNPGRWTVFWRVLRRTVARGVLRRPLWQGNRESLRMAFFSRDSILWWSLTTFKKNQREFASLRADARYAHLQWAEIATGAEATAFIRRHAEGMSSSDG